jgi:hypothetical protein
MCDWWFDLKTAERISSLMSLLSVYFFIVYDKRYFVRWGVIEE